MNHVPEYKHEVKNTFSLRIKYQSKFVKPTIATTHIYVNACWVCVNESVCMCKKWWYKNLMAKNFYTFNTLTET